MKTFFLVLINFCFIASPFFFLKVQSSSDLSEEWLSYFDIISRSFQDSNQKYSAISASVQNEFRSMIRNHNSKVVSRIGFISQQMKDLEYEISFAIQDRAIQIENPSAICILEAQRDISEAALQAGEEIILSSNDWFEELHILNDNFVQPLLHEIEILMSLVMTETTYIVAFLNPVTEIENIVTGLLLEATLYQLLFEWFVDDFYTDFVFFEQYTNEKNRRIFRNLNGAFERMQTTGNVIRNSLGDCNM